MKKNTTRTKSSEEIVQETEFYRRQNLANEVRRMPSHRSFDVFLKYNGVDLGSKHESLSRGKVVHVTYILPPLDRYEAMRKLPVAKVIDLAPASRRGGY